MPDPALDVFIEKLLQFCLGRHRIAWQPAGLYNDRENADMSFNETIGNAVMNTSIAFQSKVQRFSADISSYISDLPDFLPIHSRVNGVALEVFHTERVIENAYIFLSIMVEVSVKCCTSKNKHVVQKFVPVIERVLNSGLPLGFLHSFPAFLKYAQDHSEPPSD